MSQSIGSFSRGTKTLEILIQNQQCLIDSNQLLRWAFSHCELRYDSFQNCKPIKAMDNKNNKIDPIIAMIQALSGYLFEQLFAQDMQVITLDL
jgi:phage terminase large subunit-like protein